MNATLAALLVGTAAAQSPALGDYYALPSRTIKLPIVLKKDRATIRHVVLFVSDDQGYTWTQESTVPPATPEFVYTAPKDGRYWFNMVTVYLNGSKDIKDVTKDPGAMKAVMDATPPRVRFITARRNGDEVVAEWAVEDAFPNDAATKVHFRPAAAPDAPWQEVTLPADGPRTGVRFPAGVGGAVLVRVSATDLVGNKGEMVQEVAALGGTVTAAAATRPGVPPLPDPAASAAVRPAAPVGDIPPPDFGPGPAAAAPPPPPPTGVVPPAAPLVQPAPTPPPVVAAPAGPTPIASGQGVVPAAPPSAPPAAAPVAGPGGFSPVVATSTAPPAPSVELTRMQVVGTPRFDLSYEVEGRGPSGISRVDLYVTRDEGATWVKWSQHDGAQPSVRVTLDVPANPQVEGNYGFRLVPVSGAGLSDGAPANGRTAPDMRVTVDTTGPYIELYQPAADRAAPDALLIRWKATDKNFGPDPITVEYAEHPAGPWKPVAAAAGETVVQVSAVAGAVSRRLPNTGEFAWRVPPGTPARVFLKVSARDAAGNLSEVVTPQPITVDTTTPKARIQGIVTVNPVAARP